LNASDSHLEAAAYHNAASAPASGRSRRDGSFPLLALLQLASFSAALVACIDGGALRKALGQFPIGLTAIAVNVSVLLGFVTVAVGFAHLRSWRTACAAGALGALHGPAILAVFAAPAPFWRAGPAIIVLLLTTILLRVRSA
jgi:hypothetical protein